LVGFWSVFLPPVLCTIPTFFLLPTSQGCVSAPQPAIAAWRLSIPSNVPPSPDRSFFSHRTTVFQPGFAITFVFWSSFAVLSPVCLESFVCLFVFVAREYSYLHNVFTVRTFCCPPCLTMILAVQPRGFSVCFVILSAVGCRTS